MNIIYLLIMLADLVPIVHMNVLQLDVLSPFATTNSFINRKNRNKNKYVELTYPKETFTSHRVDSFVRTLNGEDLYGHHVVIYNPRTMLSVLEPSEAGGCSYRHTDNVLESSTQKDCLVAVNGGFFNDKTGECYGNIVSDSTVVNTFSGLKAAGFGIRKNGGIVVGYFSQHELYENAFLQLISGIGWVLRNGESYINDSLKHEQCYLQNMKEFVYSRSSRTFIGHDSHGYIHIIQVDGKSFESGINLVDAAELLKSFGLINAINLNGGGASTFVVNGTLVNYPSNVCEMNGNKVLCPMNVSTILCVHPPDECLSDDDCNQKGKCVNRHCICRKGWNGKHCKSNNQIIYASECCWSNYYWIVVLTALGGLSVIFSVFICNLYFMYRSRFLDLASPKKRKDRLRSYLKNNNLMSSSNDESGNDVT